MLQKKCCRLFRSWNKKICWCLACHRNALSWKLLYSVALHGGVYGGHCQSQRCLFNCSYWVISHLMCDWCEIVWAVGSFGLSHRGTQVTLAHKQLIHQQLCCCHLPVRVVGNGGKYIFLVLTWQLNELKSLEDNSLCAVVLSSLYSIGNLYSISGFLLSYLKGKLKQMPQDSYFCFWWFC